MTVSTPSTVTTTLNYFIPPEDGSEPFSYINPPADPATGASEVKHTWGEAPYTVQIENLRGKEDTVSLDTAGFQFLRRPAQHKTFENDAVVEKEYYPESIELIKEVTGATRAVIFDHTIRRRRPGVKGNTPQTRQPAAMVHVDQTPDAAVTRVHRHLPAEDVPKLLSKRFQIINLWRPISHPAHEWPLALCDYNSVDREKDLVTVTLKYPDFDGHTFGVKYNPNHKWKYLRGMEPEEVVLIKCYDSKDDGATANFTPHTAFEDPSTPKDAPYRESIELRFLVFYD